LEKLAEDADFRAKWREVKYEVKCDLAKTIRERTGILINPNSIFDIQVKRIHEYKRQHLNVLHIITLFQRIKKNLDINIIPRTFIFGGKASPNYFMAKLIIKLINSVAEVVNNDPDVKDQIKVIFFPDFNVKNGQRIYPAADLSEQISTAGKEASGTGNMKFALNGALTIGTLDGANIEIREEVGEEQFFLFGLTAQEVFELKSKGYNPIEYYYSNPSLREAVDLIRSGFFSRGDTKIFEPLVNSLLYRDEYMLFADYQSYIDCQEKVNHLYQDREQWSRRSILTVSRMGKFSSDRSIREYCEKIWHISPVHITLRE
jgi:starch phosphorylase